MSTFGTFGTFGTFAGGPVGELLSEVEVHAIHALFGGRFYRGSGSMAILEETRSALLVGEDPTTPQPMVLASNKHNLGPPPPSLAYRVVDSSSGLGVVQWGGEAGVTAALLSSPPPHPGVQAKPTFRAAGWIF